MFCFVVTTSFQNVCKTNDIAFHIGQRVFDGIADSGLSGKVDPALWFVISKGLFHDTAISNVDAEECVILVIGVAR